MGVFKINGTNILDIAEVVNNSDARQKSLAFSSGKLNVTGLADSAKTLVNAPSGYIYSRDILGGKLKVNGVADTVSLRGYRPPFLTNVVNITANSYFNWFDDGEVYISPTANTRSGTRISTAEQKRRSFFVWVVGSGGGGGSGGGAGSANVANGGGSGGAIWGNVTLEANTTNYLPIVIGGGGGGGTGRAKGGSGNTTIFGYSGSNPPNLAATGGTGGGGAENSTQGSGGSVTYNESTRNNATMIQFGRRDGINGALRGTTNAAMPASHVTRYMPEGGTVLLSNAYNNDGRTGSGTASGCGGCGAVGKGGGSVGDGQHGKNGASSGGGSGSGCGFAFTGTGGNGGSGYIRIFY